MEIKILPTRKFFDQDLKYIRNRINSDCELIIPKSYSEDDLKKLAPVAHVFLGPLISKHLCNSAPNLKFIQVPWTGVDNLNFQELQKINVPVCNSHSNAYAVAEHAIALMFDVAKKISYHDSELRKGNWNRPKADLSNEISPFSRKISRSKIGIFGFGHIGKNIKRFLNGFNCNYYIVDVNVTEPYYEENTWYYPISEMDFMLKTIDILFICVPLTSLTRHMVDSFFLSKMSNNAILINTSRGEVIDEDALFEALKNRLIAAAGIDTWYNYPENYTDATYPSLKNPFHVLRNLVLSSHRSAMIEGELTHLDDAITNINRASMGLEPLNIISINDEF